MAIRPILLYAAPVWLFSKKMNIIALERFQNKTLRRYTGLPWYVRNVNIRRDSGVADVTSFAKKLAKNLFDKLNDSEFPHLAEISSYDSRHKARLKRPKNFLHMPRPVLPGL